MRKRNAASNKKSDAQFGNAYFRPLGIGLALFIAAAILFVFFLHFLRTAKYFTVKEIIFNGECNIDLTHLKGQNIFDLEFKEVSGYIVKKYPLYKQVKITRILPDRLFVDFTKRQAVALVKLYKFFYVDKDSVLFDATQAISQGNENLPVILGLENKGVQPKAGERYRSKELAAALSIIANLKAFPKEYVFKKIYVGDLSSISLSMYAPILIKSPAFAKTLMAQREMEIKIDSGNIRKKLFILAGLLLQEKNDLQNIKYIDLRFKEPVIKYNEDQG